MATENQDGANQAGQQFSIQRVYIKDLSFESPNTPDIFTTPWKPKMHVEMNTESVSLQQNDYEVVLSLTVTVKGEDDKTAFLVEVKQAGVFAISGFDAQKMGHMLGSFCPNILFPFAREVVSDLVSKGGFPQLLLAPVNFDALYTQQLQAESEQQKPATH
jgi:preprotein translocase subunit SecB